MWQVDCVVNTAKASLPFQDPLRRLVRRVSPPRIGPAHETVISGGVDQVNALREAGLDLERATILEIGTGWFPILPLILRAAGVRRVWLSDVHRLLDPRTVADAVDFVRANRSRLVDALGVTPVQFDAATSSFDADADLDAMLASLGLSYVAPLTESDDLPPLDAVVSHTVLEHIPPDVLERLFRDLDRRLAPGGVMSHGVDHTDHRANRDKSLGRFDFLRYSDRVWKFLCLHPQDYTNRLRHDDYVALLAQIGHEVVRQRTFVDSKGLAALRDTPIDARFAGRPLEALAISWSHIVSRRKDR